MAAEAFPSAAERLHGAVIIEWPPPAGRHDWPGTLDGRRVTVRDAGTETVIYTAAGVTVTAYLSGVTEAEMVLYTDLDGRPLLELGERPVADGTVKTGTFRVQVAGMRIREA